MLLTPAHIVIVVELNGFISGSLLQQRPLYKPPMFNFRSRTVLWRYVALKSMHSKLRKVGPFLKSGHILLDHKSKGVGLLTLQSMTRGGWHISNCHVITNMPGILQSHPQTKYFMG